MGLKSLATGGVYIAGGIPARIKTLLKDGTLLESFIRKNSRTSTLLSTFPLVVILNPSVGLLGSKVNAFCFIHDLKLHKKIDLCKTFHELISQKI